MKAISLIGLANKFVGRAAVLTAFFVPVSLLASETESAPSVTSLLVEVQSGLFEKYRDDASGMTMQVSDMPGDAFTNGQVDAALLLGAVDDMGMGKLAIDTGSRPTVVTLGAWLPGVALGDDEEQESVDKIVMREEAVLRKAFAGTIPGAQLVRLYVLSDKRRVLIENSYFSDFFVPLAGPSGNDDSTQSSDASDDGERRADASTEQNRPIEVREYDDGLLVLPSPLMLQANAVAMGVAEPVLLGGFR